MTEGLAEWLLERIADDERVIRRNLGHSGLSDNGLFPDYRTYDGEDLEAADDYLDMFRPPRLLAECDAKRRIIEQYQAIQIDQAADHMTQSMQRAERSALLDVLRRWATVYAHCPGYLEEWRP